MPLSSSHPRLFGLRTVLPRNVLVKRWGREVGAWRGTVFTFLTSVNVYDSPSVHAGVRGRDFRFLSSLTNSARLLSSPGLSRCPGRKSGRNRTQDLVPAT